MRLVLSTIFVCASFLVAADPPPEPKTIVSAKTPAEEKATFKIAPGFTIELVAAEPNVVDPVSMCFDEKGRMFVAEMRGYPNGGVGTGNESRGRITCLTDTDGDGKFETTVVFAEGLRFPMGMQPWRGGIIVAVAPEILYLEDTNGDGKADKSTTLYKNFNLANIQQMVNSLQFSLDNWVYASAGADGGIVQSGQDANAAPVTLRGRGIRFNPDIPGSLEATSGGGQYGLTADDGGHWFTNTNSQHLRQIVLPEHYLRRNPYLGVSAVTLDIPEHGPSAKIYRISPFEQWRVERTTRRAGDSTRKFAPNELVPGGFFTSSCSPMLYNADVFPAAYRGNMFVCDPANNLVHREAIEPKGAVFTARRVDVECEFLVSTDNWFRPVHLSIGPDGAMYVLDFYREVIETPLSLPEDIKQKLNLESRGRGRIWRVAPEGFKPSKMPDLSQFTTTELAAALLKGNPWWRLTAQRLLFEKVPPDTNTVVHQQLVGAKGNPGLANLLWVLKGTNFLTKQDLAHVFEDSLASNRKNALRLSEEHFGANSDLREKASKLVDDSSSHVRFQLALSAGAMPKPDTATLLAKLLIKDGADPWMQTAALSSASACGSELIGILATDSKLPPTTRDDILTRIAAMIGAKGDEAEVANLLQMIAGRSASDVALLDGLGQGMRNSKKPLSEWFAQPPASALKVIENLKGRFDTAAKLVRDESASATSRMNAARILAFGPYDLAGPSLVEALVPTAPGDLQSAAVRSLAGFSAPGVAELLLKGWAGYGPGLRREVIEAMFSRPERALALLMAVEKGSVSTNELDPSRVQQLRSHANKVVREKAASVLKAAINADRAKVVKEFASAIELKGDAAKGKGLFKTHCAACHQLLGEGKDVGPNLVAALPSKSTEDLLAALFDPNREVDPRYVNYQALTADGRQLTGIVAVETPTSVTLKRADGAVDTVLRANLESLRSTKLSLMPEGFEKQLKPQDVADLFAFLRSAVGGK